MYSSMLAELAIAVGPGTPLMGTLLALAAVTMAGMRNLVMQSSLQSLRRDVRCWIQPLRPMRTCVQGMYLSLRLLLLGGRMLCDCCCLEVPIQTRPDSGMAPRQ